jgi:metal-responsive CopG/Arc/MetJ family transcriptional regulator
MRTTIRLDDQLLKSAKRLAHDTGKSLTAVIEDALRQTLARQTTSKQTRKPVKLTTVSGHGVRPGIDLNDSAALLAFMEQPRGSS